LTDSVLNDQIESVKKKIHAVYAAVGIDYPSNYFRPGSGFFTERMRVLVQKMGYRLVLGSIYPHDPQIPYWRLNSAHILSMLQPGGIIICHDGRSWTVPMLQRVLPEIRRRGYRVVTVTELLKEARP
jgi:peptidoglycan/xylan/chitin deacetylase (PgdA/CDA1 family)